MVIGDDVIDYLGKLVGERDDCRGGAEFGVLIIGQHVFNSNSKLLIPNTVGHFRSDRVEVSFRWTAWGLTGML